MKDIKKVLIGYNDHVNNTPAKDIGPMLAGETLRVFLSDGTEVLIEMFERIEGRYVRISPGAMDVSPRADNRVCIYRRY